MGLLVTSPKYGCKILVSWVMGKFKMQEIELEKPVKYSRKKKKYAYRKNENLKKKCFVCGVKMLLESLRMIVS